MAIVRKTAGRPSSISKRLRNLTQRCHRYKFGRELGTSLLKLALQRAVRRDVLGELNTLITLTEEMNIVEPTEDEGYC